MLGSEKVGYHCFQWWDRSWMVTYMMIRFAYTFFYKDIFQWPATTLRTRTKKSYTIYIYYPLTFLTSSPATFPLTPLFLVFCPFLKHTRHVPTSVLDSFSKYPHGSLSHFLQISTCLIISLPSNICLITSL